MFEDAHTIVLNRASDFWVPITLWSKRDPVTGERTLIDARNGKRKFIVYSGQGNVALFTIVPEEHPDDPRKLLLKFTEEHAALLTRRRPCILRASYSNNYDQIDWSGQIYSTGFAV